MLKLMQINKIKCLVFYTIHILFSLTFVHPEEIRNKGIEITVSDEIVSINNNSNYWLSKNADELVQELGKPDNVDENMNAYEYEYYDFDILFFVNDYDDKKINR